MAPPLLHGLAPEPVAEPMVEPPPPISAVTVSIHDAPYHLRGTDPAYLKELAAQVDRTMRAVSAHGGAVDSLRVAVLAALNIADDLQRLRDRTAALTQALHAAEDRLRRLEGAERMARSRSASLTGLLDEVLDGEGDTPARRAS